MLGRKLIGCRGWIAGGVICLRMSRVACASALDPTIMYSAAVGTLTLSACASLSRRCSSAFAAQRCSRMVSRSSLLSAKFCSASCCLRISP